MRMRKRLNGIIAREIDGALLILDHEQGQIHQFNETASFIWNNLERAKSAEQLATLLTCHFDVNAESAVADVYELLSRLQSLKLILMPCSI